MLACIPTHGGLELHNWFTLEGAIKKVRGSEATSFVDVRRKPKWTTNN